MNIALFVAWNINRLDGKDYSIIYTHYTYLKYVSEHFSKVYLVSSCCKTVKIDSPYIISEFKNVEVIELPEVNSYASTLLKFKNFYKALKSISDIVDIVYCRVPDPFCWMPYLFFSTKTIMHFVGDTIDATIFNEKWGWGRKFIMIAGYLPDYVLTLWAARHSKVYTNGRHLMRKLNRYGIKATPVVSSTISETVLMPLLPCKPHDTIRLIYIGYIRYAKGMKLLMSLWLKLRQLYPDFTFDLVGNGEMLDELRDFVNKNKLSANIRIHGHIDDRDKMNAIMHENDLFIFPSLSEGSPRVVIEAMSVGIPVVSTPVGALPTTFEDGKSIRFFHYNDVEAVINIIDEYMTNPSIFMEQRMNAYNQVKKDYTVEAFLSKVFSYDL